MKNKYYFLFIMIFTSILFGLSSCSKKDNEVKEEDKIIIESFDYEINRNKNTVANELSYNLSFDINFTLNQKFYVNDLFVRIVTKEEAIESKKSFHFDIEYSNTKNVTISSSTEQYPYILLQYEIIDVTSLNVNAQIKITSNDLIDDINNFIEIDCRCDSKEIIDENCILDNGIFKMSFSDDSLTYYEFDEFSESYTIVSANVRDETYIIPATYQGYPVKAIGEGAFYGCSNIKSIMIPDSITNIAEDAFEGCDNIEKATIPTFAVLALPKTCLKEVTIIGGTIITEGAFYGCSSLASVVFSDSITTIERNAFYGCSSLKEVVIPNSVTSIREGAFYGCSSLTSIVIPNNVTSIGEGVFSGCGNIEKGMIPSSVISFIPKANLKEVIITNGTSVGDSAFDGCSSLTSIVIPDSVTSIGGNAFSKCDSLTNVYYEGTIGTWCKIAFDSSVSNPMYYASHFYLRNSKNKWEEVTSIEIPNTITEIGIDQFRGFNNVTSITIPNSVISIGDLAFSECSSLTSITIPNSVTSIGYYAFDYCSSISSVYYEGTIEDWCSFTFNDSIFSSLSISNHFYLRNSNNEWEEVTSIEIPNTITEIGAYQFYGFNNVTSIKIPYTVTNIAQDTFEGCDNIEKATIPAFAIPFIPKTNLKEVIITGGTSIGKSAFSGCSSLASITIQASATSIGDDAFNHCSNLTNVYYAGSIEDWCHIKFNSSTANPMHYASHFYLKNSNNEWEEVTSIEIPNTITEIGAYQFYGFNNVTSLSIPNSVTSIGNSVFSGCSSLTSITLPFVGASLNGTKNTHFGYIFGASSYINNSNYVPSSLKEVIITGGKDIAGNAFYECSSLTSIEIPTSIISIGLSAFSGCSNLQYNKYDNGYYLGNEDNPYFILIKAKSTDISNCEINSNTKLIYSFAFKDCDNLISITIPASVISIGHSVFHCCSSLTSITIPFVGANLNGTENTHFGYIFGASSYSDNSDYVPSHLKEVIITGGESIDSSAFSRCVSLTSIKMPTSVTSIGLSAFYGCSSLVSIVIPENVTKIGPSAFNGCSGLTSVILGKSLTSIGYNAFFGCSGLTSIVIPASVTSIEKSAFNGCSSLTSMEIPTSVTSIGLSTFNGCSSLESITISFVGSSLNGTENTHFGYIFGADKYNNQSRFVPASLKEVVITGGESIGSSAFYNCSSLTSITIGNSVTSIGDYAFSGCSSLTGITIGNSVTSIGNYSFSDCSSLTSITIGNSVTSIGNSAFYNCSNLTSITIPNSVTSIGNNAFSKCSSLTNIYYEGTIEDWFHISFNSSSSNPMEYASHFYLKNSNNEWEEVTSIEIPNTIITIGDNKFYGFNNVTSITIPNSVTSIGDYAFEDCSSLTNVYYEGTIEDWCNITFSNISSNPMEYASHFYLKNSNNEWKEVTNIEIPNTITKIGDYQFYGFSNVSSIVIPNSVTSIGREGFKYCSSLTNVYYEGTIEDWCNVTLSDFYSNPMYYASHFYIRNSNNEWEEVTSIEIPNTITKIRAYQFEGFNNLISVTIPNSVTSIGSYAFEDCSNLTNVYYEGSLEDWCNITFNRGYDSNPMEYASHFYLRNSNNEWEEVTRIEIPNTITKIGDYQFYGFNNVVSITIPNNVTSIGDGAFSGCSSLTSITIPDSVTSIGDGAFGDCSSLTNITIPNSVTSIGNAAFYDCSSLTNITIPNSITSIGYNAFINCTNLSSIIIPNSVTSIGNSAFSYCRGLREVYYKGTATEWKNIGIGDNNSHLTSATRYYYSETEPTEKGNYWHYVDGKPTKW